MTMNDPESTHRDRDAGLEDSLTEAFDRLAVGSQRARRNAILGTAVPVMLGLVFLAYTYSTVNDLQDQCGSVGAEVTRLGAEDAKVREQIKKSEGRLAEIREQRRLTLDLLARASTGLRRGHRLDRRTGLVDRSWGLSGVSTLRIDSNSLLMPAGETNGLSKNSGPSPACVFPVPSRREATARARATKVSQRGVGFPAAC